MKKRIWELDAMRGLCILGMVAVHLTFDLTYLYEVWKPGPVWDGIYRILMDWGGLLFVILSGICVTLGSHPIKRGLVVLGCGLICSAVTIGMYLLQLQDKSIIIYFGILHCLGVCMLLWPVFKRLPNWALGILGTAMIPLGFYLATCLIDGPWLVPFGVLYPGFSSSDYFPLLPSLGFFLLGAVVGRTVYRNRESLFPKANPRNLLIRFFCLCGKLSLPIYLLHQPLITWILGLIL